jgi:hypothetical protein
MGKEKMPDKKFYVSVAYEKKDEAKKDGAKWDWVLKSWYFENYVPPQYQKSEKSFEKLVIEAERQNKKNPIKFRSQTSGFIRGAFYRTSLDCKNCCPQWEVCDKPCPIAICA